MFSIIIPLYNKAGYIAKSIQSVLSQTYQEFELIVIDDGSTDDSFAQLSVISYQLSVNNPEVFRKLRIIDQENQGVSMARNNGVKAAKYDYIAFLDADDWWEPTYLEKMKELIEGYPEAGIYGSSYYLVKNSVSRIAPIGVAADFSRGYINYCQVYAKTLCMPLWTGAVIIKKNVFDDLGGFKTLLKLGEDFDVWVRIALKFPVAFLNEPLANYNQDVEIEFRGVVDEKIYDPTSHYIFNLEFLEEEERKNGDLKVLLDKLRVYTLFRYRKQNAYPDLVRREIMKVDFKKQPLEIVLQYKLPRFIIAGLDNLKLIIYKRIKKK